MQSKFCIGGDVMMDSDYKNVWGRDLFQITKIICHRYDVHPLELTYVPSVPWNNLWPPQIEYSKISCPLSQRCFWQIRSNLKWFVWYSFLLLLHNLRVSKITLWFDKQVCFSFCDLWWIWQTYWSMQSSMIK